MGKITIRGELKKAGKGLLDEFIDQIFGSRPKKKQGGTGGGGNHYHVHNHFCGHQIRPEKKKKGW